MATQDVDKEMNQLRSDVAELREDMAALVKTMKDAGVEQGHHFYDRAQERARETGEAVRERAHEAYNAVGREVEERPLTSVLAAFGTGFVVGMLLDRRNH